VVDPIPTSSVVALEGGVKDVLHMFTSLRVRGGSAESMSDRDYPFFLPFG
jgi:hypothetical protein